MLSSILLEVPLFPFKTNTWNYIEAVSLTSDLNCPGVIANPDHEPDRTMGRWKTNLCQGLWEFLRCFTDMTGATLSVHDSMG